jgi:nitroreductase
MTRSFADTPLDVGELTVLLDLARRAPSAGFSQGTHFLVLDGDAVGDFWRTTGAGKWFADRQPGVLSAPVIVLPLADPSAYTRRYAAPDKDGHGLDVEDGWAVPYWLTDTAMATQQLLMLIEDRGWGALFFGIFRNHARLMESLGVPAGIVPIGAVAVGHRAPTDRPTGTPTRTPRREVTDVVHVGRWNGAPPTG